MFHTIIYIIDNTFVCYGELFCLFFISLKLNWSKDLLSLSGFYCNFE